MSRAQPARRRLLATLQQTGPISDRSGRATSRLAEAMGYTSRPVSLSPLLSALEADGLVEREVRGRRCFLIELTRKGQAMAELDAGLDHRRIAPAGRSGDDDSVADEAVPDEETVHVAAAAAAPAEPAITSGTPALREMDGTVELLRRQLHDALIEIGGLKQRVSELERLSRAQGSQVAPMAPRRDGVVESLPHRSGRSGR